MKDVDLFVIGGGSGTITAKVDPAGIIEETDNSNNARSLTVSH